jgi:hypothetical protein
MDEEKFDFWLEAYGRAWENRDPAAVELFSENATYQETPFDEPARGREAIAGYWARVTAGQEGVRFGHEVLMVSGDTGVVPEHPVGHARRAGRVIRRPYGRRRQVRGVPGVVAPSGTLTRSLNGRASERPRRG